MKRTSYFVQSTTAKPLAEGEKPVVARVSRDPCGHYLSLGRGLLGARAEAGDGWGGLGSVVGGHLGFCTGRTERETDGEDFFRQRAPDRSRTPSTGKTASWQVIWVGIKTRKYIIEPNF